MSRHGGERRRRRRKLRPRGVTRRRRQRPGARSRVDVAAVARATARVRDRVGFAVLRPRRRRLCVRGADSRARRVGAGRGWRRRRRRVASVCEGRRYRPTTALPRCTAGARCFVSFKARNMRGAEERRADSSPPSPPHNASAARNAPRSGTPAAACFFSSRSIQRRCADRDTAPPHEAQSTKRDASRDASRLRGSSRRFATGGARAASSAHNAWRRSQGVPRGAQSDARRRDARCAWRARADGKRRRRNVASVSAQSDDEPPRSTWRYRAVSSSSRPLGKSQSRPSSASA